MNKSVTIIAIIIVAIIGYKLLISNQNQNVKHVENDHVPHTLPEITPISHATFVLGWDDVVIYNDPVGEAKAFEDQPEPDLVLISDVHGDHFNLETLMAVVSSSTKIVVPQAVAAQVSVELLPQLFVLANGGEYEFKGIKITAIPMYNFPESDDSRHVKGRGNGYFLERDGTRVYIAGDTADISEMRALENVDIAFVPMNLPYTMSVESAADAVLDFAPHAVYPYHYRTPDGLSDVNHFKEIVHEGNQNIEVILLDWYPE